MKNYDLIIIGGGPAGLAAAVKAYDDGTKSVLIIERDNILGGVLNQCIHNGFGLTRFKESLTGGEYAARFIAEVEKREIAVMLNATVIDINKEKIITVISSGGVEEIKAKSIILAMGCRERSKGALNIAGDRPSGIFSAGTAQRYVNLFGLMPGKEVVILGSGDIGLIMARRMTLEGAKVKAVCEIMPYSSGLKRNIEQCLNDFNIPLYLNHTITKINGGDRVESVVIATVDKDKKAIKGTEQEIKCDTVLFSVGLIPENELTKKLGLALNKGTKGVDVDQYRQTEIDGVFACGNVLQVHDLVDFVSEEAEIAGLSASRYIKGENLCGKEIKTINGENITYVLPQKIKINTENNVKLFFRVANTFKNVIIKVRSGEKEILSKKKIAVAPGEMETLILSKDRINNLSQDLVISLEVVK